MALPELAIFVVQKSTARSLGRGVPEYAQWLEIARGQMKRAVNLENPIAPDAQPAVKESRGFV
jgi:hypothetical protein